jgi:NAD(P)-dependent dehydrogenase (short-subunit alcohol dehydrogenase family)
VTARRIVITGAASGIGAATWAQLAARGDRCLAVDRVTTAGREILPCNLADQESIETCCRAIEGPIDGVAHVAGVSGTLDAETVFRVNYLGARMFVEALSPKLSDGASVVMVSSLAARRCLWEPARLREILAIPDWRGALDALGAAATSGGEAYEVSKRLILAWLPLATAAGAARRVRFNVVTPGPVETPLLPDFRQSMGEERIEAVRSLIGRHARPEEIAAPIVFLLDPSSSWVNGIEIVADGGLTALREAAAAA